MQHRRLEHNTIEVRKGTIKNEDVLFENGSLTITKAPLTISVGNYTKKQGDAMPTFKASYTGFKNGEDESVLIKQPVFETTATAESAPGEYPITVYGVEADNYEVKSYIAGTLTVEEGVTDISHIEQLCDKAAWYTLQGVKLSDKPSMPGVYSSRQKGYCTINKRLHSQLKCSLLFLNFCEK